MRRPIFLSLGFVCLLVGGIGVILPLLPTTPFVLLAAYCFSRSSARFHQMLLNHRLFGPMIRDWDAHGVIPFKVKLLSSTMMVVMISYPVLFRNLAWWADAAMIATALVGISYVWSRPSRPLQE